MKSFLIISIILVSLLPVYWTNNLLKKYIRPRQSMGRLLLYLISGLLLVFVFTFLVVLLVKQLIPDA